MISHFLRHPFQALRELLINPRYFWAVAALVVVGDAVLTQLIVRFIPYTEIDWETYMAQVAVILKGETNYSMVSGPTGPLVYPAGHVHIHRLLYKITDAGQNMALSQQIYAGLYVSSLILTCCIYRKAGAPNWLLLALPLSKRLHSIYVLRLFNDCWSVTAALAAVLAYQLEMDDLAVLLYSAALSVKMSVLLYLPGLLVLLYKRRGLLTTFRQMITILSFQAVIARTFIKTDLSAYLSGAFDLSRVFLFKWTVNWRMLGEELFLDRRWAAGLLVGHISVLVMFGYRWCRTDGGPFATILRGMSRPGTPAGLVPVTPDYVATVLFTSNLVGVLFARSLHYQFYSWYAQQLPFLVFRTRYAMPIKLALLVAVEFAWNVYPSTNLSSSILLLAHSLLLAGIWRVS
ncbi:dolichyl-P-Man:Man(5)GlcNAc(2)-PP-dolichol alpha-1,3-mannosyltransferase [Pleurotus pulmonarius]|nr:dolichyl-P-Man:Man(5)GlcNAc(2)-PP-dolichol alpha-1,3-mannosyltransferase [Pleurotus pulmonarius]KAF4603545.1 dolichyl-P-Man:Man(5)GlcNAc(2)-PP-dolichol alpha-1,3-mannosyltransferase [Pleurotus pulmonarius]